MRSVFVAFDPPLPPTGGGTRTYHMLKAVAEVSACHLFLCFPIAAERFPPDVRELCKGIDISQKTFTGVKKSRLSIWLYQLRMAILPFTFTATEVVKAADYYVLHHSRSNNLLKRWLYQQIRSSLYKEARKRYASGFQIPARTLERLQQYRELEPKLLASLEATDLLWVDFSYPLSFFNGLKDKFPALKMICNAHNLEYLFYQRMAEAANESMQKEWLLLQSKFMKQVELEGFLQCDEVVVCSDADKMTLEQEIHDIKITVVPNGVDTAYFQPQPVEPDVPTLLFTGTMTYAPNEDAVHYFIDEIFPLVKKEIPSCVFVVAGAHASRVFPEYSDRSDVQLVDSPPDMRPYYNCASAVVVPLRSGSGTRLKILEAAAMMKPIISTSVGAEGLDMSNNIELIIANETDVFSKKLISVLRYPEKYKHLAEAAYISVKLKYDWIIVCKNKFLLN